VFVVREGGRGRRAGDAGAKLGDLVAVAGDVRSGEKAGRKPPADLASGTRVKVARSDRGARVDPRAVEALRARRPGDPGAGRPRPRRGRRRLRGADGAVGLGQVDAAQPRRRASTSRRPATIKVAGVDIAKLSEGELADWRAANVGFIFQFYNLMPVLTAFGNVELPLLLTSLSRRERHERVDTALSLVGLSDRAEHYPNELSGGQQQRVAIARALIADPTLIVADEPTGDLDRATAGEILGLLER
jgi:energy-coupling factor transporter ATP-binding protein EcfA2